MSCIGLPSWEMVLSGFIFGTRPVGDSITSRNASAPAPDSVAQITEPYDESLQNFSYVSLMCSTAEA